MLLRNPKKKAEKVAAAIEQDVMDGILALGKSRFNPAQMQLYVQAINRRMAIGGMNLRQMVEESLEEVENVAEE